jgi:uracil-DNA glycosylase family 4
MTAPTQATAPEDLNRRIIACRRCPRLVEYRQRVAREKRRAYRDQEYWGRPVPSVGDPAARVVLVSLAPGAHGSNRTGRMFTGDGSGDFLTPALHRAGFANQATSISRDDGLQLRDLFILAIVHCAPPGNRPLPEEIANCRPYLRAHLRLLPRVRVMIALGKLAFDGLLAALDEEGAGVPRPRPTFAHGAEAAVGAYTLLASYHPSLQNTQTGRLSAAMLDDVLHQARRIIGRSPTA